MISPEKAEEIIVDIALLKQSTSSTLKAIQEQSESGKELLQAVNNLTAEIKEDRVLREAHDENREIQDKYVQDQIKANTKRLDYLTENYKQPLERLKVSQSRWDKFTGAIFSKAGTTVFIIIIVAILYLLGVDPKSIKL